MDNPTYPKSWQKRFDDDDDHDDPDVDPRSVFAHDRDRVIYSSAFRRLAGTSQVVAAAERGDYHTRLTHTLKVAQLGRRIAEQLRRTAHGAEAVKEAQGAADLDVILAPDPDLIEAACLAHDLGHPPFGHVGERTLNKEIDGRLDAFHSDDNSWTPAKRHAVGGFEGNAQTFRIITYLSVRRGGVARTGLNLTKATVAATVKYPWLRQHVEDPDDERAKWGAYGVDAERLSWAMGGQELRLATKPTFEAQVMDWCDDVTYAVHDVMDFYRGGLIPLNELLAVIGEKAEGETDSSEFGAETLQFLEQYAHDQEELGNAIDREELLKAWGMVADCSFIDQPWQPKFSVKAAVQKTTGELITMLVKDVGWTAPGKGTSTDYNFGDGLPMLDEGDFVVDPDPVIGARKTHAVELLNSLIGMKVIRRPRLGTQQVGQEAIVRELLLRHYEHPKELLPLDRLEELGDPKDKLSALRTASDHVSSLAEADAEALYRRVTGTQLGAFSDIV